MIDLNELRLGNFVELYKVECTISGIGDYGCTLVSDQPDTIAIPEVINPIPITPEWLERLGFETKTGYVIMGRIGLSPTTWIDIMNDGTAEVCGQWNESVAVSPCKYIHQLQNLYHALTGHELTVKELTPSIS